MLSYYFKVKTETKEFTNTLKKVIEELKGKKVIIYGAGEGFKVLSEKYNFKSKFEIIALADKEFECNCSNKKCKCKKEYKDFKTIAPKEIINEEFDYILVCYEDYKPITTFLQNNLKISEGKIRTVFVEEIKDERANLIYLDYFKFGKSLPKLIKKFKDKKVVLYGAGAFLELIKKYYDISGLNVMAVSDKRFLCDSTTKKFLGYKTCSPEEIKKLNPDAVIVATKFYINIIEDLYYNTLSNSKIKIKPLVKKPLIALLKEIWG